MLARHGQALAEAAEAAGVALRFEAAVAGGIPVVKALTEGLAGNAVTRLMGVMNGTCNYILTRMEAEDAPYAQVLGGGAARRLRRGRPGVRRRRHRRGAEAGAAGGDRLRDAGRLRGHHRRGDRAGQPRRHRACGGARLPDQAARRGADDAGGLEARMQPCLVPARLAARPARRRHQHGGGRGRLRRPHRDVGPGGRRGADGLGDRRRRDRRGARARSTRPSGGRRRGSRRRSAPGTGAAAAYYLRFLVADAPGVLAQVASALGDGGDLDQPDAAGRACDGRGAGADRHAPGRAGGARPGARRDRGARRSAGRRRWRSGSRRSEPWQGCGRRGPADVAAMQAIYAHHVLHGLATFEEVPPDAGEMARRRGGGAGARAAVSRRRGRRAAARLRLCRALPGAERLPLRGGGLDLPRSRARSGAGHRGRAARRR